MMFGPMLMRLYGRLYGRMPRRIRITLDAWTQRIHEKSDRPADDYCLGLMTFPFLFRGSRRSYCFYTDTPDGPCKTECRLGKRIQLEAAQEWKPPWAADR